MLDREHARVAGGEGADFLRQLPDYIEIISRKRVLRRLASQMREEAETRYGGFLDDENALLDELVEVAPRLRRAREIDDSALAEPDRASHEYGDYMASLAYFDKLVAQTIPVPPPLLPEDSISPEPVSDLLRVLRGRLYEAKYGDGSHIVGERPDRRPDLDDLADRRAHLAERHGEKLDAFRLASRTHPGFAYMRLEGFAGRIKPVERSERERGGAGVVAEGWWTPGWVVRRTVQGAELADWERHRIGQIVRQLKDQLGLFHARLVRELGLSELKFWRRVMFGLAATVGNAVVQFALTAILAAVVGFVSGYLLGHSSGSSQPPTSTVTTTSR
jgi:hypothetical protein